MTKQHGIKVDCVMVQPAGSAGHLSSCNRPELRTRPTVVTSNHPTLLLLPSFLRKHTRSIGSLSRCRGALERTEETAEGGEKHAGRQEVGVTKGSNCSKCCPEDISSTGAATALAVRRGMLKLPVVPVFVRAKRAPGKRVSVCGACVRGRLGSRGVDKYRAESFSFHKAAAATLAGRSVGQRAPDIWHLGATQHGSITAPFLFHS